MRSFIEFLAIMIFSVAVGLAIGMLGEALKPATTETPCKPKN